MPWPTWSALITTITAIYRGSRASRALITRCASWGPIKLPCRTLNTRRGSSSSTVASCHALYTCRSSWWRSFKKSLYYAKSGTTILIMHEWSGIEGLRSLKMYPFIIDKRLTLCMEYYCIRFREWTAYRQSVMVLPVSPWYWPAGQGWQGSRPLAEIVPGAQPSLQSDGEYEPMSTVVWVSGHAWQEVDPVSDWKDPRGDGW